MRLVTWLVKGESHEVLLSDYEERWYRDIASRITRAEPGEERSGLLREVATIMDAKALLDAQLAPAEP